MTDVPVLDAVRAIARGLEERGFDYAFGGAIALAYWGVPRATVDVDVGVSARPMQLPELFAALESSGCDIDREAASLAAMRGDFGCRWQGIRVDVFLPELPLAVEALERRARVPFGDDQIWIVTAEDSVVFKLLYARTKDIADLERLFAVCGSRLDYGYIDRWVDALFSESDPRLAIYRSLRARA